MKVGVAGCGRMGLPMARALRRAKIDTIGYDTRRSDSFEDLEMRFEASAFARDRDVIISVVRTEQQTETLLFGKGGLADHLGNVSTLIFASTLDPDFVRSLADRLPKSLAVLDAPVIGDPMSAEAARLTFLVGGDDLAAEEMSLVFAAMGEVQFQTGQLGSGMTAAILNNFVVASSVAAVRTVLEAAPQLGLDERLLLEVLNGGTGQTWFGQNFDALTFSRAGISPENTLGHIERKLSKAGSLLPTTSTQNLANALLDVMRRLESINVPLGFDDGD